MSGAPTSAAPSEFAPSELSGSEAGEATPAPAVRTAGYPPYPPYSTEPAPPSIADTIFAGRDLRFQHKSLPKQPIRPPPKPAKPKGPKATDVKTSRRALRAHARCLRRHGAVLTDRLERMSKPPRRSIIYMWREYAHTLPPETIARMRSMLDADEPFKPDQAYEYFVNLKKTKKRNAAMHVNQIKKDVLAMCGDKRFVWARNATVAFARGIQQRLSRPGRYALADGMLRLSNIILREICGYMNMKAPSRRCTHPKARFMMEVADKVAVWIDEILTESDDRMLMMDFDEDDDVLGLNLGGGDGGAGFADDFLNMMGGGGLLAGPKPAYLKFTGEMLEAFLILTDSMQKKGSAPLLTYGKFSQTYSEGVDELKRAPDFDATEFNTIIAAKLSADFAETAKPSTPANIEPYMKDMVTICSNYLAQVAEFNKDKGPAFKLLVKTMRTKPNETLYQKGKAQRTFGRAANELDKAKGLESDHDDPNLSQEIHSGLSKCVENVTPADLQTDMKETLDICSKYLSQQAIDEIERGPAFDILIKELERDGAGSFTPQFKHLSTKFATAYTLKTAPGFSSVTSDPQTVPVFTQALHKAVDVATPKSLVEDMKEVIDRCAIYLSAFVRDRDKCVQLLLQMMKGNPTKEFAKRNSYEMTYGTGATETENSPTIIPFLPIKDIADEGKVKLTKDMESSTPGELKVAMKCTIHDVSRYLSQPTAMRSGAAGERYNLNFLAAVKKSMGDRPLYKYKAYGQTYSDAADVLKYAGRLESDPKCEDLQKQINSEMNKGVPTQLAPTVASGLSGIMVDASKHLAKVGTEKGKALDYLVDLMKQKGETPLGQMQGYQQSYNDGARRIEKAPTLTNDKVDKGVYESVRGKLTTLTKERPSVEHEKHMSEIVDESSKFLAAPLPETEAEKRRVLADLMTRKGDAVLGQEGNYKMTYTEGGDEIMKAPIGVTTAHDEAKKKMMLDKVNGVIPDQKMQQLLKDPANEGAAHITEMLKAKASGASGAGGVGSSADGLDASETGGSVRADGNDVEAERRKREAEEEARRRKEEERKRQSENATLDDDDERRRRRDEEERRLLEAERRKRAARGSEFDAEREQCMAILHTQLRARGGDTLYKQPNTELSHAQASEWLQKPPMKVEKSVKESADTARLSNKFERKLHALVSKVTPEAQYDTMQDVVIESSRLLSEYFVAINYKTLVRDVLISEMQKRGNEILIEVDGAAETFFFAAQRLKKTKSLETKEPCNQVAYYVTKKLEDMIRCRSMARKLTATMKDHIKDAADYLSELVTKPDEYIEAYVSLLGEMEAAGDSLLIEGDISKSYKDAAAYLRQLTSYEDQIRRPNATLQTFTEGKLKNLMANVTSSGYSKSVMDGVIGDSTRFLVSYIMLQGEKTEALKLIIQQMDQAGNNVLLRHGNIRKSYTEGADLLRGKNTDQLGVVSADPVVSRKIQIKLKNLMTECPPDKFQAVMEDVIDDTTSYLAVHILQPRVIQICKCMKNVFVQCELWCDEILRRVARPCCTCSRHVSAQALEDLAPAQRLRISPGSSRAFAPGLEISLTQCPANQSKMAKRAEKPQSYPCPASKPTSGCGQTTTSYLMYSTACRKRFGVSPTRLPPKSPHESFSSQAIRSPLSKSPSFSTVGSLLLDLHKENYQILRRQDDRAEFGTDDGSESSTPGSYYTPPSSNAAMSNEPTSTYWQTPTTMYAEVHTGSSTQGRSSLVDSVPRRISHAKSGYSSPGTPIISTDQMADWHAMMVSLMWNVHAWRDWIQENIDRALAYGPDTNISQGEVDDSWSSFQRKITTESLQWRQYNTFSRQLTMRLAFRYKDKQIVSPTRASDKTDDYMACQREMLEIIDMFNRWTQWLTVVVKETDAVKEIPESDTQINVLRWSYFKKKVEEYSDDWTKYNIHLKVAWEQKYRTLIAAEWLPPWSQRGPVWVVSACGAVPSGAVAAGLFDAEVIWVARTTHRCNVLPAALHPSKHCCLVYSDGAVHHYTKYQVMCNAEVRWVAWRAGAVDPRAVRVAAGVHVGRVLYRGSHLLGAVHAPHYRCHVVIFERPFAFNCYELLLLADGDY